MSTLSNTNETSEVTEEKPLRLSPTRENYLKVIYLEQQKSGSTRGCNITQILGVNRSTVAVTFRELKKQGLIDYVPYGPIHLTPRGEEIAARIVEKNTIVHDFFERVLDLDTKTAERIACELEHILTPQTLAKLKRFTEANLPDEGIEQ